jgi:hypothetical protein
MTNQQTDGSRRSKTALALALLVSVISLPASADNLVLKGLKIENATADAQRAVAANDYRLLGVKGFTVEVPGVGRDAYDLEKRYGVKVIEGTSDAFSVDEDRRLNEDARAYAKRYNELVLSSLKPTSEAACARDLKQIVTELDQLIAANPPSVTAFHGLTRRWPNGLCNVDEAIAIAKTSKFFSSAYDGGAWYTILFGTENLHFSFGLRKDSGLITHPAAIKRCGGKACL